MNVQKFIDRYEWAYFSVQYTEHSKKDFQDRGLKRLNTTTREVENYFFVNDTKWQVDTYAIAWKAGKLGRNLQDGKPVIKDRNADKTGFKIGRRKDSIIFFDEIERYCDYLIRKKTDILGAYNEAVASLAKNDCEAACISLEKMYETALYEDGIRRKEKVKAPAHIGSVYIINLIFFLLKGKAPIYDQFAHKALKSLYAWKQGTAVPPDRMFIGAAPDKTSVSAVASMYAEYLWLLMQVFGMREIPRSLDRALWVYGHCSKPYWRKGKLK